MPPKKSSANQPKPAAEPAVTFSEGADPVASAISIIDKKVRNLEKRRNKLVALKESAEADGKSALDKDQQEAITKIKDVHLQLDLARDLQKQFATLQTDYQKHRKRQQRLERQQAKEAEREAERKAVSYTIRVQDMLNSFGDEDKENFRTGRDGAVKLSEDELSQIDELYKLINPRREENPNYDTDVGVASEHMLSLMEGSSKEVLGTTYKNLHDVLEKVELSGYFSQPSQLVPDDEEDSEEEGDEYKSAEEQVNTRSDGLTSGDPSFKEEVDVAPEVPPEVEAEPPTQYLGGQQAAVDPSEPGPAPMSQAILGASSISNNIMNYMPSAPSPTFPALGTSPVLLTHDDGFSFMHDSELERKQSHPLPTSPLSTSQQITHQAPPSQVQSLPSTVSQKVDYAQYSNRVGVVAAAAGEMEMMAGSALVNQPVLQPNPVVQGTTDVTTGQPSPSPVQPSYQSTVSMSSSAPPTNNGVGVVTTGVGGALYSNVMPGSISSEAPSGFRQQQSHNQAPYYRGSSQNKGGRGPSQTGVGNTGGGRRPGGQGGGSKGNYYNNNRNGRGMQGGYESQGQGYGSRSYSSGGGGGGGYQQQRGGGRPNYRTSTGGQRKS